MNTEWTALAACRGEEDLFDLLVDIPSDREATLEAKAICVACPARLDCLEAALTVEAINGYGTHGVRGGLDEYERRKIVAARNATGPRGPKAECGTPGGFSSHRRAGTPACDPCRRAESKRAHEYNVTRRAALAGGAA